MEITWNWFDEDINTWKEEKKKREISIPSKSMSEENQDVWLPMPLVVHERDSPVPYPPESSDVIWLIQENGSNPEEMILPQDSDNGFVIIEDSTSETENPNNRFEERAISAEETDSSDSEVTLNSLAERVPSLWEPEEDPVLNVNSVIIIERESDIVQEPSMATVPENPNAGVENPIIRLENPDYEPEERGTDTESSRGSNKRSYGVMISEDDDGQTCPVCLDAWTNAGAHRLSSLKCGHLFGKSCISRWISQEKKKHCPQCNKKANANDIRELYATKLTALDATEKNRLEKELEEIKEHKRKLELELLRSNMTLETCKQQLETLKSRLATLEVDNKSERRAGPKSESLVPEKVLKFHLEKTYEIQDGSCRVSAYSPLTNTLIVAHQIRNQVFRGYALKKITRIGSDYHGHSCLLLHGKAVRDLCFHPFVPNLILSVSFDKSVKVSDVENRTVVQTYKTNYPLWSCCWDHDDQNIFYVGAGNGFVYVYDGRVTNDPIAYLSPTDDCGAVVSLRFVPASSPFKGTVICCRLNSIVLYEKMSTTAYVATHLSELIGPFFSLSYNSETNHLLASCRPSVENPKVKHVYCELNGTRINKIFSFYGGTRQTLLCRSCFVPVKNDTLVAAFQENSNTIELWSTLTGSRFQSIPVNDNILDLVSIRIENRNFLGTVSDSIVRFFEGPT